MNMDHNGPFPAAPLRPEDFAPLGSERTPNAEKIERESISNFKNAIYQIRRNRLAMISFWVMVVIVVMALLGPVISPHDPITNHLKLTNNPPSSSFWFGTDDLGRDMFARTWKGAQVSLFIGLMAALIDIVIGVIYGGIMGYFGGKIDEVMNRICEILYAIPYMLVVIMLTVVLPQNLWTLILAMSITGWINMAWIVRGQIMQLKNQEYVLASRSLGAGGFRLIFKHLIPNTLGPIIVTLTLTVPTAIFTEAFLSFLGLGVQAPLASLGTMVNDALSAWVLYPWRMLFPGVLISITMLAFNIIGDGLRDAFDPKMKDKL